MAAKYPRRRGLASQILTPNGHIMWPLQSLLPNAKPLVHGWPQHNPWYVNSKGSDEKAFDAQWHGFRTRSLRFTVAWLGRTKTSVSCCLDFNYETVYRLTERSRPWLGHLASGERGTQVPSDSHCPDPILPRLE